MSWGPKAPDMSAANRATDIASGISQEQWDWYQNELAPRLMANMDSQTEIGRDQYNLSKEAQQFNMGLAKKYDDRYWNTQAPLEDSIIADANKFDSGEWSATQKGLVRGDIGQAYAGAEDSAYRNMSRMGINPASGASRAMTGDMARSKALAEVSAASKINLAADQLGWSRKADAAALGRGLPGFSSSSNSAAMGWSGNGMNASRLGGSSMALAGGLNNSTAGGASAGFLGAGRNYYSNAIESARTPGFDALMGLAAGGMRMAGSMYKP